MVWKMNDKKAKREVMNQYWEKISKEVHQIGMTTKDKELNNLYI
jgi:hypothetical protein